jgi:hypothetical protein
MKKTLLTLAVLAGAAVAAYAADCCLSGAACCEVKAPCCASAKK